MTRVLWTKLRKLMNSWEREFRRSSKIRNFWCWDCSEELQDCHAMRGTKTSCGELHTTGEEGHCSVYVVR